MSNYYKIKTLSIIIIFLFFNQFLIGQNSGYFYKYSFNQFLLSKTANHKEYIESLKNKILYPPIAKENSIEGTLKYLIINSGKNEPEIILVEKKLYSQKNGKEVEKSRLIYFNFDEIIKKAFNFTNNIYLNKNTEKYITEFSVIFDLEPYEKRNKSKSESEIVIKGKRLKSIEKWIH